MVFEWFPYFHGKYFTYQDYFGLTVTGAIAAVGLLCYVISKVLPLFGWILGCSSQNSPRRKAKENLAPGYMDVELVRPRPVANTWQTDVEESTDEDEAISTSYCPSGVTLCAFLASIAWGFVPISLMAFDLISTSWSVILSSLILLAGYMGHLYRQYPSASKPSKTEAGRFMRVLRIAAQNGTASMQLVLVLIIIFSFGFTALMKGTCIAIYNGEDIGFVFPGETFSWSSTLTRHFELNTQCPPGPPCHFFATLPEDSSSSVIINVHTDVNTRNITVYYEEATNPKLLQGKLGKYSTTPRHFVIDTIEKKGQRVVHNALLEGLTPNTTYYIQVYYNNQVQASASYRTLPDKNHADNITIVQGGDAGANSRSYQILTQVSLTNPDAVLIGGDLGYDNNIPYCYYAWDGFLKMFEDLNKRVGRLVPLVMSIGNHDAGLDSNSERLITIDESGPWFFAWMAQSTKPDPENPERRVIPDIGERPSYDYHLLGKILLLNLDTAYISPYNGEQLKFIQKTSAQYSDYLKMAMYHAPIYSACGGVSVGEKYWVPQFDNFRYFAVFENHVHSYKRTFPITGRQYNENGTVYLGDGTWGAQPRHCAVSNATGIMAELGSSENFFWVMNVDGYQVSYKAITPTGDPLGNGYSQKVENYVISKEL